MKRLLKLSVPLVACLLCACDFAPTYVPPPVATPTDFKESADWTPATPKDSAPRGPWWRIFQDPALDRLEDQVTIANQNLKVAVAQYDEARADVRDDVCGQGRATGFEPRKYRLTATFVR